MYSALTAPVTNDRLLYKADTDSGRPRLYYLRGYKNIEVDMQGLVRVGMLALTFSAAAPALDLPRHPALATAIATFESLDKNADRRLSRSEAGYDRVLSAIFADNDVDGDGYLTPSEYARATGGAPVNL